MTGAGGTVEAVVNSWTDTTIELALPDDIDPIRTEGAPHLRVRVIPSRPGAASVGHARLQRAEDCEGEVVLSGPDVTDDALMKGSNNAQDNNQRNGPSAHMQVGALQWSAFWRVRSLLRFDLSAIPEGARVDSAELRVFAHDECSSTGPRPDNCGTLDPQTWQLTLHTLRRPWIEAEVTHNEASAGVPWARPGAADTNQDAFPEPAAVLDGLNSTAVGTFQTVDLTGSVQRFVDGELPNHGWVFVGPEVAHYRGRILLFWGSEFTSPDDPEAEAKRPQLSIRYTREGCQ